MCEVMLSCGPTDLIENYPCDNFMFEKIEVNSEGIVIGIIPENTVVYKSMYVSADKYEMIQSDSQKIFELLSQDNVNNLYANSTSWFSNYNIAKKYASATWAKDYRLTEFKTIKKVKLFYLYSESNLKLLVNKIENDLNSQIKKFEDAKKTQKSEEILNYINANIQDLRIRLDIIHITTGYGITYAEQIEKLLKYGNLYTNDPTYDIKKELEKRVSFWPCNGSFNNIYMSVNGSNPAILKFGDFCTVGPQANNLNRISWTTDMDKMMTSTIIRYFNVDGYCAPTIPTLFHKDCKLDEEFAFAIPRDTLQIIGFVKSEEQNKLGGRRRSKYRTRKIASKYMAKKSKSRSTY